jgi:hypothetical protein
MKNRMEEDKKTTGEAFWEGFWGPSKKGPAGPDQAAGPGGQGAGTDYGTLIIQILGAGGEPLATQTQYSGGQQAMLRIEMGGTNTAPTGQ